MMKDLIKKYRKYVVAAIVVFFMIVGGMRYVSNIRNQNNILKHNIEALNDSIHYYTTKNGELIALISGYVTEISDLKLYSQELADQVATYKKTTGNKVTTAVSAETVTVLPEKEVIFLRDTLENNFTQQFDFSDEWRTLTGELKVTTDTASVRLNPEVIHARITAGLDEKLNVFVTTDNPYIHIESLLGFTVPKPRKHHWGLGIQAGMGFDPVSQKIGPTISVGVNYNLLTW